MSGSNAGVRQTADVFRIPTALRHLREAAYPEFPYLPPERYPEFGDRHTRLDASNHVYAAVRAVFRDLELDSANYGLATWNPLGRFLQPGQRALIKPNWVLHANHLDGSIESLLTHTSVMRVVIDYLVLALDGRGSIDIADAPLQGCDFGVLKERTKIEDLLDLYRAEFTGIQFSVIDLRKTTFTPSDRRSHSVGDQYAQAGDPRGYTLIDLAGDSLLTDIEDRSERFRVTMYDHRLMNRRHARGKHQYLVSNSVLSADLIINLPKLKTHIKAGITGALKNLVGINGHKEYLPHHVNGWPGSGGDQYQRRSFVKPLYNTIYDYRWRGRSDTGVATLAQTAILRGLAKAASLANDDGMYDGGWSGNDTVPRTTLDLNNALYFYGQEHGSLSESPVRNVLSIVDGVVAGEGNGPLWPTAKPAGIVIGGWNPLAIDTIGAMLIGYDPMKVRLLKYGFGYPKSLLSRFTPALRELEYKVDGVSQPLSETTSMRFALPEGWQDASV